MMVEILDSSQDFGMSNGSLPQWKRELLQRRAARGRGAPPPAPPAPPAPAAPADEDEELCYGPGIVKRLKSRYLSLALREAARRRPSVLRRAASLEHVLDERPRPRPRPASLAAPAPVAQQTRRDSVKRARSVDALSRLDSREEPVLEPEPVAPVSASTVPPPAPKPPVPRAARPPRRPAPLLRDTERPPPDVVRSALRKFETAPTRRAAPAARVSAVLRGLEGARRSVTPDRSESERSPSPQPEATPPPTEPPPPPPAESPPPPSPSPAPVLRPAPSPPIRLVPVSPTIITPSSPVVAPVLPVPTVVSPVPSPIVEVAPPIPIVIKTPEKNEKLERATVPIVTKTPEMIEKIEKIDRATPSPIPISSPRALSPIHNTDEAGTGSVRVVSRAALEGIAKAGSSVRYEFGSRGAHSHLPPLGAANPVLARRVGVIRPMPATPEPARVNGHSTPEPRALSRIGAAGIERAWSGSPRVEPAAPAPAPWTRGGRGRAPLPAATSVVFNFSNRKEVPDYIENDGIILRASRRNMIKAGEAGVVVLRPELVAAGAESDEEPDCGPPSPCAVRFVNDNVLINGRSSMLRDPSRSARLKLQFDDSLTRTFEYPSETSLCEESPGEEPPPASVPAPALAPAPADAPQQALADNTHIASAALSRYTPSKTPPASFQLGLAAPARPAPPAPPPHADHTDEADGECEARHAVPCGADAARAWSDARRATDLLF